MSRKHFLINNTTMSVVITADSMEAAQAWATSIPPANDFSVISACAADLAPYTEKELRKLWCNLNPGPHNSGAKNREQVEKLVCLSLENKEPSDAQPPLHKHGYTPIPSGAFPDGSFENQGDNEMATATKKTAAKTAPKKAAVKKAVAPKTKAEPKAKAPKVERAKQNGVSQPAAGAKTRQVWDIADKLSAKAGAPADRKDVLKACADAGMSPATAATQYQRWRQFHGLVKAVPNA